MGIFGLTAVFLTIVWLSGLALNILGGIADALPLAAIGVFLYGYLTKLTI